MRLIGLDATVYSPIFAHDGNETSWNVATGNTIATLLKLSGKGEDRGYDKHYTRKLRRPPKTIHMEHAPGAEEERIRAAKSK